jgi:sn-glycerol 3-phosphate transport system substrate-binding protein
MEQFSAIHGLPIATKSNGYGGLDGELVINKTKFVDYIKYLKAGYDAGIFKLKLPETGATNTQAFSAGDCQMMMSSVADHGTVGRTQKAGLNWAVAFLPVYEGTKRLNSLVGGASLWVLQGKTNPEYKGAAAFLAFIAKPESELFWSTRTGYIPVTKSGFSFLREQGFYDKPQFKGRELALASLTASPVNPDVSRGIRLGGFIAIRKEVRDGLQDIFAGNVTVQAGLDAVVERSNTILRRFEKTYAGKQLP